MDTVILYVFIMVNSTARMVSFTIVIIDRMVLTHDMVDIDV